jgi:hypothetical protein
MNRAMPVCRTLDARDGYVNILLRPIPEVDVKD